MRSKNAAESSDGDHNSAYSQYSEENSGEKGQELKEENASNLRRLKLKMKRAR